MSSLIGKRIGGQTYCYLREVARVDGKPKIVSRAVRGQGGRGGGAAGCREERMLPERTRHLAFGEVAAAWSVIERLGVAAIIDEVTGLAAGRCGRVGGHLPGAGHAEPGGGPVLEAGVRGLVGAPRRRTGGSRSRRRRWITAGSGTPWTRCRWRSCREIERRIGAGACARFGLDLPGLVLDMTNFATFIDTGNEKAPIAQRGKAKQKRS